LKKNVTIFANNKTIIHEQILSSYHNDGRNGAHCNIHICNRDDPSGVRDCI
jgi:hypothetical protein